MGYSVVSSPRVRVLAMSVITLFALFTVYTVVPSYPVLQTTLNAYDIRALFVPVTTLNVAVVQLGYDVLRVAPSPLLSLARYLAASAEPYASLTMAQLYKIYARTFSGLRTDTLSTTVSIVLWSNLGLTFVFFALYLPWALFSFVATLDDNDLRFITTLNTHVTRAIHKIKTPLKRLQQCLPHIFATISGLTVLWPISLLRVWCYSSRLESYLEDSLAKPRSDKASFTKVYLRLARLFLFNAARSVSLALFTLLILLSVIYGAVGLYTLWTAYLTRKKLASSSKVSKSVSVGKVAISRRAYTNNPSSIMASTASSRFPADYYLLQDFVDQYELGYELGAGSFGVVLQARRHTDGCEVAVKFVKKDIYSTLWEEHSVFGLVPHDVIVMDLVQHENIVALLDVFSDDQYVYIVQEIHGSMWYPSGEQDKMKFPNGGRCLEAYLRANGAMPSKDARYVFDQLVNAVYSLHSNGVTHCDIKPTNILIDSNLKVKLIDFGNVLRKPVPEDGNYLTYRHHYSDYRWFHGTKAYTPPEIYRCKHFGGTWEAPPADIWALGLVLCYLLTGSPPMRTPYGFGRGFIEYDTMDSSQWEALLPMWGVLDACLDWIPEWRPTIDVLIRDDEDKWTWMYIIEKTRGRAIDL